MSETLWLLTVAGGPILLIALAYFGYFRNRGGSKAEIARAERGARELREEIEDEEARRGAP